jgi:hypothetical protein
VLKDSAVWLFSTGAQPVSKSVLVTAAIEFQYGSTSQLFSGLSIERYGLSSAKDL